MKLTNLNWKSARLLTLLLAAALTMAACGDAPLASIGDRSSGWINEPEVTTTSRPHVERPTWAPVASVGWFNDDIVSENLFDPEAVVAAVFARREGDRFIQASRFEIVSVVPEVVFPSIVPYGAMWVSSQLIVENTGRLSAEPTAAFGIWSAVPYTRSRSVAQMAVLRVAHDPDTAADLSRPDAEFSCARFAEQTTEECSMIDADGKKIWKLFSASGVTLLWFEGSYRYELFGRPVVDAGVLERMAVETVPLIEIIAPPLDDA
jgi:hypothetical protein